MSSGFTEESEDLREARVNVLKRGHFKEPRWTECDHCYVEYQISQTAEVAEKFRRVTKLGEKRR